MENMTITVLGTEYTILFKNRIDDSGLDGYNGYCNCFTKEIVVCDLSEDESMSGESPFSISELMHAVLRHEIIHAFLYESGLSEDAIITQEAWPVNEEMVDWFALQAPKIYTVYRKVGCI